MPIPKDKRKFALWLYPDTLEKIKQHYTEDDCRSKSEFIEKAVLFYIDHLAAADGRSILPNAIKHEILVPEFKDWNEDRLAAGGNAPHIRAEFSLPQEESEEGEICQTLQL